MVANRSTDEDDSATGTPLALSLLSSGTLDDSPPKKCNFMHGEKDTWRYLLHGRMHIEYSAELSGVTTAAADTYKRQI
jgi:hypothetical protein